MTITVDWDVKHEIKATISEGGQCDGLEKHKDQMSRLMGKATICMGENKGADQLRSN